MSDNVYGNLGNEMKTMQDERKTLRAGIRDNRDRIRVQTGQALGAAKSALAETSKANGRLGVQTRQILAQASKELKARTRQTLAAADQTVAGIRKDVAGLKAAAGEILRDAGGFMARTSSDNATLKTQTRKMLSHARAQSKAQTREVLAGAGAVIAQTRTAVAGVKADAGRTLAEAAGVMRQLSEASRQRATAWRDILHSLHSGSLHPWAKGACGVVAGGDAPKATAKRAKTGGKQRRKSA